MPTYEYECPSGHRYETREGFDAPATQKCIKCRKTARRILFAPPIVFKGSGFYVTDSRKAESAPSSESTSEKSETADKSEPSSNGKSETKSGDTSDKPSSSEGASTKADKAPPKADKAATSS
jgi:putative FmdB family regulatory protein